MKLYEDLCIKDERNPMYDDVYDEDDSPIPRRDCYCGNCFHGIDRRALRTLELIEACKVFIAFIENTYDHSEVAMSHCDKALKAITKAEGGN